MLCLASGEKREKSTVMYFALLSNLSISKWHSQGLKFATNTVAFVSKVFPFATKIKI